MNFNWDLFDSSLSLIHFLELFVKLCNLVLLSVFDTSLNVNVFDLLNELKPKHIFRVLWGPNITYK